MKQYMSQNNVNIIISDKIINYNIVTLNRLKKTSLNYINIISISIHLNVFYVIKKN